MTLTLGIAVWKSVRDLQKYHHLIKALSDKVRTIVYFSVLAVPVIVNQTVIVMQ